MASRGQTFIGLASRCAQQSGRRARQTRRLAQPSGLAAALALTSYGSFGSRATRATRKIFRGAKGTARLSRHPSLAGQPPKTVVTSGNLPHRVLLQEFTLPRLLSGHKTAPAPVPHRHREIRLLVGLLWPRRPTPHTAMKWQQQRQQKRGIPLCLSAAAATTAADSQEQPGTAKDSQGQPGIARGYPLPHLLLLREQDHHKKGGVLQQPLTTRSSSAWATVHQLEKARARRSPLPRKKFVA